MGDSLRWAHQILNAQKIKHIQKKRWLNWKFTNRPAKSYSFFHSLYLSVIVAVALFEDASRKMTIKHLALATQIKPDAFRAWNKMRWCLWRKKKINHWALNMKSHTKISSLKLLSATNTVADGNKSQFSTFYGSSLGFKIVSLII